MITIDDKVQFAPFRETTGFASEDNRCKIVTGTVVMINYANKGFSVEYDCGGVKLRTSFKFFQIGKDVRIYG